MPSTDLAPGKPGTDADIHSVHSRDDPFSSSTSSMVSTMPGPERCGACHRPMCRCMRCNRPPGMVRHEAHGYCKTCYVRARPRQQRPRGSQAGLGRRITIDEVVIELAVTGWRPKMNLLERRAAIRHLEQYNLPARVIAERLGITPRTVERHRANQRTTRTHQAAA